MVDSGSWYAAGFRWPHDGHPYQSEHFTVYSDGASQQARRSLAEIGEELLTELKERSPTGALTDNPDRPALRFREDACVQCGLCRATCPESVVALEPRINFAGTAREAAVVVEEEPFACTRCGKPFGVRSSIERMVEKLAGHPMFAGDPAALDRIRMCEDCRVTVQFEQVNPMASRPRPETRTTDDDLRERELERAREMHEKAHKDEPTDG